MGAILCPLGPFVEKRRGVFLFDDFNAFTNAAMFTAGGTGGNTAFAVTNSDGVNGLLTTNTNAAANNEVWVATTRKNWLVANNLPLRFEVRLNYAEANTNQAAIFVGFSSAFATLLMAAGGATLNTNMSAFGFYKFAGATTWGMVGQVGTTQTTSLSDKSSISTSDQILRMEIAPVTSTICEVSGWLNDLPMLDPNNIPVKPLKLRITYTSMLKMCVGVYVQAGDANAQTAKIDYISADLLRGIP